MTHPKSVEHDNWFRTQVAQAIAEADSPDAQWLSAKEADASWADKARQYAQARLGAHGGTNDLRPLE